MSTDCQIYVNGKKVCNYFTNESWVIQNLGTFEKGDSVKVEIEFHNGLLYYAKESDSVFYYIDYDAMTEAFSALEYGSMYVEEYKSDARFSGTIDLPAGQELIFTTIPYDEGWQVYVDGEKAETVQVLGTLLAIPSTEGFHELEFVYRPDCAVYGGILSILGIVIFAVLILWSFLAKKRTRVSANGGAVHFFYHKGDEVNGWALEMAEEEAANASDEVAKPQETLPETEMAEENAIASEEAPMEEAPAEEDSAPETKSEE